MADKLVRGNSMDGAIRVFAAVTTDLVNEAQRIHHTYPVATGCTRQIAYRCGNYGCGRIEE